MRVSALAALIVAALPAGVQARPARDCGIRGAELVARARQVQVVTRRTQSWACTQGKTRLLGSRLEAVRLNGSFVAYRYRPRGIGCAFVVALDMRRGTRLTSAGEQVGATSSMRLSRGGGVVWTTEGTPTVHVMDAAGEELYPHGRRAATTLRDRCARANTTTTARNRQARLYVQGQSAFGCDLGTGRRTRLGPHTYWLSYAELAGLPDLDFALAGRFARALRTTAQHPSEPGWITRELSVFDLRSGARIHDWKCCGDHAELGIREVVLSDSGAIAWTYGGAAWPDTVFGGHARDFAGFLKSDAGGENAPVDPGHENEAHGLTIDGSTLRWLRGSDPESTSLS